MAGETPWQTSQTWSFPASTASIGMARNLVADFVANGPFVRHREDVRLMVSELVTNAIVHAASSCEVSVNQTDQMLRVEVTDGSDITPEPRRAKITDVNGRGLFIVESLADRWGVRSLVAGKSVWFELLVPGVWD